MSIIYLIFILSILLIARKIYSVPKACYDEKNDSIYKIGRKFYPYKTTCVICICTKSKSAECVFYRSCSDLNCDNATDLKLICCKEKECPGIMMSTEYQCIDNNCNITKNSNRYLNQSNVKNQILLISFICLLFLIILIIIKFYFRNQLRYMNLKTRFTVPKYRTISKHFTVPFKFRRKI